jgi:hypothetical protein
MYYTITKELLSENNKAFQFLHEAQGFDFEKEYFIAKHEGRFTYNQIKKAIGENMAGDYTAALILVPTKKRYSYEKLFFIDMNQQAGKFEPLRKDNVTYWGFDIDYFYIKADFEEIRKTQTSHVYIIAQNNEYLKTEKKPNTFDYSQRFRYIPSEWGETCRDGHGNTYINKLTLMLLDGSANTVEYNTGAYYRKVKPATVADVIDKSGYLLLERRREWEHRAAALRAERDKAAAVAADFSEKEQAIIKGIDNVKLHIAEMALNVETEADARVLDSAADNFRRLMYHYSNYTEKAKNKTFPSVGAIENYLNDLQVKINEIMGEM